MVASRRQEGYWTLVQCLLDLGPTTLTGSGFFKAVTEMLGPSPTNDCGGKPPMNSDVFGLPQQTIRATDTNSLLRLYDQAKRIFKAARSQRQRERADRAMQRFAEELRKRDVRLEARRGSAPFRARVRRARRSRGAIRDAVHPGSHL
jgi:hypothetical protein